jgi:hypothetical protein
MTNGSRKAQSHHPECSQLKIPPMSGIGIHNHEGSATISKLKAEFLWDGP